MPYNIGKIRQLVKEALVENEIITLCYDNFPEIAEDVGSSGLDMSERVNELINYVKKSNGRIEKLLETVKQLNPEKYAEFEADLQTYNIFNIFYIDNSLSLNIETHKIVFFTVALFFFLVVGAIGLKHLVGGGDDKKDLTNVNSSGNNSSTPTPDVSKSDSNSENEDIKKIESKCERAFQQLQSENFNTRSSAITSLKYLEEDAAKQNLEKLHERIILTLENYIRNHALKSKEKTLSNKPILNDIQTALSVIAWRSRKFQDKEQRLQLDDLDLRGLVLKSKEPTLKHSITYEGANFERAHLNNVDFENANLRGIILKGAILHNTNFKNAEIHLADLTGADLTNADLEGTDLGQAKIDFLSTITAAKNWEKTKALPSNICEEIKAEKIKVSGCN